MFGLQGAAAAAASGEGGGGEGRSLPTTTLSQPLCGGRGGGGGSQRGPAQAKQEPARAEPAEEASAEGGCDARLQSCPLLRQPPHPHAHSLTAASPRRRGDSAETQRPAPPRPALLAPPAPQGPTSTGVVAREVKVCITAQEQGRLHRPRVYAHTFAQQHTHRARPPLSARPQQL